MKITHVVWGMGIGGTENMLADIMNKQIKNVKVILIIIDDVYCENIINRIDKNIKIYYIKRKNSLGNLYAVAKVNLLLLRDKPNVIHCHNPNLSRLIYINKIINTIFCVTCHDTNIKYEQYKQYERYDKVFAISEAVKKKLKDRCNQSAIVIDNGIDFKSVYKKVNSNKNQVFTLVQVSRLDHEEKGQELMLRALQYIIYSLGIKNISYVIIGDGPSKDYLINYAEELNVNQFCVFQGSLDRTEIYSTLKNYDLLIQPSFYEGFGLTIVEGMAALLPVIVSNIDGPKDIVGNGKYGYVFESGDFIDLVRAIIKVIEVCDNKPFQNWIEENYIYAKSNYDVETTALKYLTEYKVNA